MKFDKVEISEIEVKARVRKELGDIEQLAESIDDIGLLNPIIVRKDEDEEYVLVAGERRLEACKRLGWEEIEAKILEEGEDES